MGFDEAVSAHTAWKREFRRCLAKNDGRVRPANLSVYQCELGRWIYGEGENYSSLPEYETLKSEHVRFHGIAAELVNKANSGESIDAEMEPCCNSEFSKSSSAIVIAIMAMKKYLSR